MHNGSKAGELTRACFTRLMMYMHHESQICACTALRKASRAVTRLYDERLAKHGVTTTQFSILRNLARHGALPLSDLAALLVMERTTLYRTLTPMERAGWVGISAGQGRTRIAKLTTKGRRVMAAAEQDWSILQRDMLGGLGAEKWQSLQSLLAEITADASRVSQA